MLDMKGYVHCSRCPNQFNYQGESSRTAFTRLSEHLSDYRAAAAAQLPALPSTEGGRGEFGKGNGGLQV